MRDYTRSVTLRRLISCVHSNQQHETSSTSLWSVTAIHHIRTKGGGSTRQLFAWESVNFVKESQSGKACKWSRRTAARFDATAAVYRGSIPSKLPYWYLEAGGRRRGDRLVSCCLPSDAGQSAETCTEPHFFIPLRHPRPSGLEPRSLGRAVSVNCETRFIEATTHNPRRGRPTLLSSLTHNHR